jgi:hypothetical protein
MYNGAHPEKGVISTFSGHVVGSFYVKVYFCVTTCMHWVEFLKAAISNALVAVEASVATHWPSVTFSIWVKAGGIQSRWWSHSEWLFR